MDSITTKLRSKAANQLRLQSDIKFCSGCKQTKTKADFSPEKNRVDGLRGICKKCKAIESRRYRINNPDKAALASKHWAERNRDKRRVIMRRFQTQIKNRVFQAITSRMYSWIKGSKQGRTKQILDYGWDELRVHLEKQFTKGMSWDNYGEWHVDHIVPLSSFTAESIHDPSVQRAWAITNLRPLWATENSQKSGRITHLI